MNRCNTKVACKDVCSCIKTKTKRKKTKQKIKSPLLPFTMKSVNASIFPLAGMNLAENIANFLRPQIAGIMQNTRPRTLIENKRVENLGNQLLKRDNFTNTLIKETSEIETQTEGAGSRVRPGRPSSLESSGGGGLVEEKSPEKKSKGRPKGSKNKPKEQMIREEERESEEEK